MHERQLSTISEFTENLQCVLTLEEAVDTLYAMFVQLGFGRLVYARAQVLSPDQPLSLPPCIIERGLPQNWQDNYFSQDLGCIDPYFLIPCERMTAVEWSQIESNPEALSVSVREFIDWVHDIGLRDGLTVPVRTSPTHFTCVSAIGCSDCPNGEIPPDDKALIILLINYFVNCVSRFENHITVVPSLSKRERECLFWLSQGKTMEDTATILGISFETVRIYLKRVTAKLKASNRTHALAKAISLELIDVEPVGY